MSNFQPASAGPSAAAEDAHLALCHDTFVVSACDYLIHSPALPGTTARLTYTADAADGPDPIRDRDLVSKSDFLSVSTTGEYTV